MTGDTAQSDIVLTHTVYRRDLAFTAARALVLFWTGAAMVVIVWALSLPVWASVVLAVAWTAQASRPFWDNGDTVVAVLRLSDEYLMIQDRRSKAGEARAIALRDVAEVTHIGSLVAVRCKDDSRDGTTVGIRAASTLAKRIRKAVTSAQG
jgi:hypothetical protein